MIQKERIKKLAEDNLGEGMFLVDVKVGKTNVISVLVDAMGGVTIEQCATLSRAIESNLDRETEDFELEVSSAGLGQPFKVVQQYYKNVGKEIEVDLNDGSKMKGILEEVFDGGITLAEREPGKNSGNTKNLTEEGKKIEFKDIKSAKEVFTF